MSEQAGPAVAPPIRRPVVFVKYFDKGSTVLGAHQMADGLVARGIESRVIYASELSEVSNSILIFIKTSKLPDLVRAKARGNALILDVQDTLSLKRRLKNQRLYDGVIFRSQKPMDDYARPSFKSANIYLQWNPRFRPNTVGDTEFRLAYLGDPRSFTLWGEIPDLPCIGEDRFFDECTEYNCQISIRVPPREVLYKPTCKTATAAACHANLITTRDEATLELLGEDYPYYTEPDAASVQAAIAKARDTFGTDVWHAGLEKMRSVKESHHIDRILERYVEYLSAFDG